MMLQRCQQDSTNALHMEYIMRGGWPPSIELACPNIFLTCYWHCRRTAHGNLENRLICLSFQVFQQSCGNSLSFAADHPMECQESLYRFASTTYRMIVVSWSTWVRYGVESTDTEKYLEGATSATMCSFTFLAMIWMTSSYIADERYEGFPRPWLPNSSTCFARNGSNSAISSVTPRKLPLCLDQMCSSCPLKGSPLSARKVTTATTRRTTSTQ